MINNLRFSIFAVVFFFFCQHSYAQLDTQHAVGVRFGSATGISYRYTLHESRALEGILSWQSSSRTSRFRIVDYTHTTSLLPIIFPGITGLEGVSGEANISLIKIPTAI